ncbi:NADAR family protein [Actinoalloteichus hymeniacidonis]|uniref:RibA/ribD-fused protein n=1 Tax=Actinoalloteichus hymeniacidonis TaxID=340345 RepID=A0AAC9MZ97_9PSEU|nr:NADAR family protein [Actinoalloteichus hymeniacidonis]AOS65203.1 ribA/ribD-fused protein [Actinoalloteichus hymeniacidonis]MBB5906717.1 hypothetical protein [Actinoalloteichus hymeniacidonis]
MSEPDNVDPRQRVADLCRQEAAGRRLRFVFFWGERGRGDGSVGAECLSQWWCARFEVAGRAYRSAEHYMMERKARLFGDDDTAERILASGHPGAAKQLGRQVRGFDPDRWAAHREQIVVEGNLAKFTAHPKAADFLLGTGSRILVEASPLDRIWGVGLSVREDGVSRPSRWRGLNLLGFALMEVRSRLAAR